MNVEGQPYWRSKASLVPDELCILPFTHFDWAVPKPFVESSSRNTTSYLRGWQLEFHLPHGEGRRTRPSGTAHMSQAMSHQLLWVTIKIKFSVRLLFWNRAVIFWLSDLNESRQLGACKSNIWMSRLVLVESGWAWMILPVRQWRVALPAPSAQMCSSAFLGDNRWQRVIKMASARLNEDRWNIKRKGRKYP